jgi:DNA helicase HerA-like ATPase
VTTTGAHAEGGTEPTAWSLDGRSFTFECPVTQAAPIGSMVLLSTDSFDYVGQVVERAESPSRTRDGGRVVLGGGTVLGKIREGAVTALARGESFERATIGAVPSDVIEAWIAARADGSATLDLGSLQDPVGAPARLAAVGFNRHTFLCGQSGSGKTYTLGLVLEQLLLHTSLRIVVLDPNSDYVGLDQLQAEAHAAPGPVHVFRREGAHRLRIRFGRLPVRQQAMVLALDPVRDMEEYDELRRYIADVGTTEYSLLDIRRTLESNPGQGSEGQRRLLLRIDNLGIADWSIWAEAGEAPLLEQLGNEWRAAIFDLGKLDSSRERSTVAASVMAGLWQERHARNPVLIVVDEAHNVCPREPIDAHEALAVEHTTDIAAEGRKYGMYLLLATQRPHKLPVNVLSQCENLLLMRTNSVSDVSYLADIFAHIPRGLIARAPGFELGEGLAAGRISPTAQLFRSGRRRSPEGGADVPTTWAHRRSPTESQ